MLTVWGRKNSSNVIPVMWAVGELDLKYVRKNVGGSFGGLDTEHYLAMNPNKTVPTIDDNGFVLWESNAIVRYLARTYGQGVLWPEDARTLAEADQWMDWAKATLTPIFFPIFWGMVRAPDEQRNQDAIDRAVQATGARLRILDQRLSDRPFVAGATLSMGDLPLGALAYRYFNLAIDRPGLPNVEAWYRRLGEREAFRKHVMVPFGASPEEWLALEKAGADD